MTLQRLEKEQALSPTRRESLLRFTDVTLAYEDLKKPTLRNVSFELCEGDSVLFLGPSGCGKSTLAMLCARLIPSSVEAELTGGLYYHPDVSAAGGIGYVFQDPDAQFALLQVADEIAFGMENTRVPRAEMLPRTRQALLHVRLSVDLNANHATFSGGMKQKLAVASALAMSPKLLIFDEPTANLDPLSSRLVFEQMAGLHQSGQTMIVIEHKFHALIPYMNQVVLFTRDGSIRKTGPTLDVLKEEWDWLVQEGVIPSWMSKPTLLSRNGDGSSGLGEVTENAVSSTSTERSSRRASSSRKMAMEVCNASVRYGNHEVWSRLSTAIPHGSFVALVGPNGSGKSSLLQAMAGLHKTSEGDVKVFGHSVTRLSLRERNKTLSFCFQNPEYQFIYGTVGDELANRATNGLCTQDILELLDEYGLHGLQQQNPFALSQGQKRRLSVAAMVRDEHEIYLLDEPTFGQDARTQEAIMGKLAELHRAGKTIVMTTHDMDLVRRFATMVLVLCDGGIGFQGTPEELFQNPVVMRQAHLLADVEAVHPLKAVQPLKGDSERTAPEEPDFQMWQQPRGKGLAAYLNPPMGLIAGMLTALVGVFAQDVSEALAMFLWPFFLLFVIPRLTPWRIAKRLAPFLVFFVLYIWSFTAFSKIPPGTPTFNVLWFHLSWHGAAQGMVVGFRMFAAFALSLLVISGSELANMIVGLCQTFRLRPKFAYGILAGLRLAPLFQTEWVKLRQARQLRGKDARSVWLRPVMYALPLLAQAIRLSERVATAMEARGFVGAAAMSVTGRTYLREIPVRWWDFGYAVLLPGVAVLLLVLIP